MFYYFSTEIYVYSVFLAANNVLLKAKSLLFPRQTNII
uniref:Uncharacterized protein n=1 Tax=Anguilla anguilla TaxID=7936 RepID=A0A0E9Q0H1_ANGAN